MEQNAAKKRTRLNLAQREALLSFMEKNPTLATGRFPGPQGSKIKAQLWNELSDYLNRIGAMGHGTTKTPDRWMKSWQDWRCDVKAKAWRLRQNGIISGTAQLTAIEERLISFMGNECQEEHMILDSLEVPADHYSDDNTHEYTLAISDNAALTVDISSPSPSDSHNLSPVRSSSVSPPVTCIAQSTSSYPPTSQHQIISEQPVRLLSPNRARSPGAQERTLSQPNNPFSVSIQKISVDSRKRRIHSEDRDDQSEHRAEEDERAVYYAERLAAAMKAKADAVETEAAAEERRATAAERKATALEREAAAAERQAAAAERQAAAAERIAAAVEKELLVAERKSMITK